MSIVLADGGTFLFTPEGWENFALITLPTIALTIVTIWTNDRLVKITLTALSLLNPRRRKVKVQAHVVVETHGRHEAPEDAEHGSFFGANHANEEKNWDGALANMTKGHQNPVWPEQHQSMFPNHW
jgi:hypothetical protein